MLHGEFHRGRNGAAGELDLISAGLEQDIDPCAGAFSALAARLAAAAERRTPTTLAERFDPRDVFAAARAGDPLARAVAEEEACRIARHIVPLAAVADVVLVVLGGGIGANGDLLLEPVRTLLGARELGDAGRRALDLRQRLDHVRSSVPTTSRTGRSYTW